MNDVSQKDNFYIIQRVQQYVKYLCKIDLKTSVKTFELLFCIARYLLICLNIYICIINLQTQVVSIIRTKKLCLQTCLTSNFGDNQ